MRYRNIKGDIALRKQGHSDGGIGKGESIIWPEYSRLLGTMYSEATLAR
jgi:hypothetical protein